MNKQKTYSFFINTKLSVLTVRYVPINWYFLHGLFLKCQIGFIN